MKNIHPLITTASTILLTTAALGGCGLAGSSSLGKGAGEGAAPEPWQQPVRKAFCGATDRAETALQGQVPAALRAEGFKGFNCNLELVGQWQGEGASWQHAWYGDCAYYDTANSAEQAHLGTVVLDASKRSNPVPTQYLTEAAMLDPWESLKVHAQRGLLAGVQNGGTGFAIYDVKPDCRKPDLVSDTQFDGRSGHEGNWSADGLTYYGSDLDNRTYYPIAVDDPAQPQLLLEWPNPSGTHGMATNKDGTRGYFTLLAAAPGTSAAFSGDKNGVLIADTSDIQARRPDADIRIISEFLWDDGSATGQHPIPISYGGKPYLIFVDEAGVKGKACNTMQSPFAFARIIDISDETEPALVAKLMLETHDPANCEIVMADYAGQVLFGYDSHYCSVDREVDPTVLGCGYFNSGIRVFDIRNPYFPREIAYFNPPAQLDKQDSLPGSNHLGARNADWCSAQVRFVPERGELWTTCHDNGFVILRFTNGVWPFKEGA